MKEFTLEEYLKRYPKSDMSISLNGIVLAATTPGSKGVSVDAMVSKENVLNIVTAIVEGFADATKTPFDDFLKVIKYTHDHK